MRCTLHGRIYYKNLIITSLTSFLRIDDVDKKDSPELDLQQDSAHHMEGSDASSGA